MKGGGYWEYTDETMHILQCPGTSRYSSIVEERVGGLLPK